MAWQNDFTKVGLTALEADRTKLENSLVNGIYGDLLKRLREVESIVEEHGKDALSQPWDSTTANTFSNIYSNIRSILVNYDAEHDSSASEKYIKTVAELPS